MVDIVANPEWKSVRVLERDEVALGGVDGNMNEQATSLVARTELLKQFNDVVETSLVEIDAALNAKASNEYVDNQLSLKAPQDTTYTKIEVDNALSTKALQSNTYTKAEVDTTFAAYVGGRKAYQTLAAAQAAQSSLPANTAIEVTNDPTSSNNGTYQWNGTTLTKSAYDPLSTSKAFTVEEVGKVSDQVAVNFEKIEIFKTDTNPSVIPVLVDESNKTLIGYDTENDQIKAGGLQEQVLENLPNLMESEDTSKIAVLTDSTNKILIGYDTENDKAIVAGLELPNQKPLVKAVNHLLFYGQSLSIGATATTILSNTQPYNNLTFNTSPRKDSAATSVIPLVEQFNNPSSDAGTNRGETPCSGAANYASRAMMLESGIDPHDHVIFASTAGHGGYRIDQLEKGASWYNFFIEHVSEAKRLNGDDYKVQVVCWAQGENDAGSSSLTPYETYKTALAKLQKDANYDIKAITGQADDVKFITYQLSVSSLVHPDIALAQLHLAQNTNQFCMATPMYHLPYDGDNIHLTNVGYKWMGAYFGRAYKQLIVENRKPDFINPKSAQIINDEIHVKFDVPKLPLVLDTSTLAVTTNNGFKVLVDNVEATISNVTANNNTVVLKLSSVPSGVVKVRYALDFAGSGLKPSNAASGNLRDSTDDVIEIDGTLRPLYHVCPHFELTAYLDKGI